MSTLKPVITYVIFGWNKFLNGSVSSLDVFVWYLYLHTHICV